MARTKTAAEFLSRASDKHGDRYSYGEMEYVSLQRKIEILCSQHGSFMQLPVEHLKGSGCPRCAGRNIPTPDWIKQASDIHGGRYDYRNVVLNGSQKKVSISCSKHGIFEQLAYVHLRGAGCPKCSKVVSKSETKWLDSIGIAEHKRHIPIRIEGYKRPLIVDAYDLDTNTVYEFYGDLWHGNPTVYSPDQPLRLSTHKGKTYGDLYRATMLREERIRAAGYSLVTIWESDWSKSDRG